MTQIIEVIVSSAGETKIETKGFAGRACQEASRFLEQALGIRQSEHLTPQFHQGHEVSQVNQQRS